MGIAAQIKPKAVLVPGGLVAQRLVTGEADLALHQISEILAVPDAVLVGPIPAEIQNYTVYAGGVGAGARDVPAAQALLALLAGPGAKDILRDKVNSRPRGRAKVNVGGLIMLQPAGGSLFDELRVQYETARTSPHVHEEVEGYQQIDARLHKAYAWLEKAMAYLDELKPPIEHRYDLGHGMVLEKPRFNRGYVGQHTQRIVGFPVIDEINIWYEIATAQPLSIEVSSGGLAMAEKSLDDAGLQYSARRVVDHSGIVTKCVLTVPPAVPAAVMFKADYRTGLVNCAMTNVDRFDRVTLEFHSNAIEAPLLDELLHFILGRNSTFLRRAPLAGIHGQLRA